MEEFYKKQRDEFDSNFVKEICKIVYKNRGKIAEFSSIDELNSLFLDKMNVSDSTTTSKGKKGPVISGSGESKDRRKFWDVKVYLSEIEKDPSVKRCSYVPTKGNNKEKVCSAVLSKKELELDFNQGDSFKNFRCIQCCQKKDNVYIPRPGKKLTEVSEVAPITNGKVVDGFNKITTNIVIDSSDDEKIESITIKGVNGYSAILQDDIPGLVVREDDDKDLIFVGIYHEKITKSTKMSKDDIKSLRKNISDKEKKILIKKNIKIIKDKQLSDDEDNLNLIESDDDN